MGMAAILVMWPGPFIQTFFTPSQGGSTWNLALIGQAVLKRKIFENGGHIHVYSPGQGQTTPWCQLFFINTIIQSIKSFVASFPH